MSRRARQLSSTPNIIRACFLQQGLRASRRWISGRRRHELTPENRLASQSGGGHLMARLVALDGLLRERERARVDAKCLGRARVVRARVRVPGMARLRVGATQAVLGGAARHVRSHRDGGVEEAVATSAARRTLPWPLGKDHLGERAHGHVLKRASVAR